MPPWLALIVVHQDEEALVTIGAERADTNRSALALARLAT